MTHRFKITDAGVEAVDAASLKTGDMRGDKKTCKHDEFEWRHEYDEDSQLGDSYWCTGCGELTQVG